MPLSSGHSAAPVSVLTQSHRSAGPSYFGDHICVPAERRRPQRAFLAPAVRGDGRFVVDLAPKSHGGTKKSRGGNPSLSERRMRSIWVYFLVTQDPLAARARPDLSAPALPPSLGSAGSADRQDRTGWSRGDSRRSAVAFGRPRTPQGAPRAPWRPPRQLGTRSRNPETVATSSTFGVTVGSGQVRKWRRCAVI
jgi:hypothetical protein